MSGREVTVLLVDDNHVDREAVARAFSKQRIANTIVNATNGEDALDALRGTNGRTAVPRPYLVLLDLNMPRMGGLEFLEALRADPTLHDSIVFVLTTSKSDEDRVAAYGHNIAGYVQKSDVGAQFVNLLTLLDHYWRIVLFP